MRHAAIAQLVEHNLAKVGVASSSLVCRSKTQVAAMVELVDTRDLKSLGQKWLCGFESRSRHNVSRDPFVRRSSALCFKSSWACPTARFFCVRTSGSAWRRHTPSAVRKRSPANRRQTAITPHFKGVTKNKTWNFLRQTKKKHGKHLETIFFPYLCTRHIDKMSKNRNIFN